MGLAIAAELARDGTHVSICARGREDLNTAAVELRKTGVSVVGTSADATKNDDVTRVVDETIAQLGHIDILVNNAGDASLSTG